MYRGRVAPAAVTHNLRVLHDAGREVLSIYFNVYEYSIYVCIYIFVYK